MAVPGGGGVNAGSGTLIKECCFRVRVRVRLGVCQWNAGSGSWVEQEPGSGSIFFCKECCFRVRVMGDVQMSNRLKLKIARCGIQNPGRFCLWNRKSWTLELLFLFFIYLFIFLDFWDPDKHAILTSRFDNAFKYFQFAKPVRDPQFKVRSPMVLLDGCNQHRTCSGLPNKRSEHGGLPWFLTSSRKVREIFVFWVLYAFSTLGDHRQLVEWPAHFYFIKLTCKFFMFQASIYHTLPKTSDHFFLRSILSALILVFTRECWDESKFFF